MVDAGDERLVRDERDRLNSVKASESVDEPRTRADPPELDWPVAGGDRELMAIG